MLTPDSLEPGWLPYECGQFLATRAEDALVPVRVGVEQALLDLRVPVLQRIHSARLESKLDFSRLCATCASKLGDTRPAVDIIAAADAAWDARATALAALLRAIERILPSRYTGTTRYARLIADTNFNMPRVFELYEQELFFVGINHGFVLNIERDPRNFIAMVESLLAPGTERRIKFMISDLWEPAVAECYGNLVQAAFAKREIAKFTNIYKTSNSPYSLAPWLEAKFGKPALERLIEKGSLEIRTFASPCGRLGREYGSSIGRSSKHEQQGAMVGALRGARRTIVVEHHVDVPCIERQSFAQAEFPVRVGKARVVLGARVAPRAAFLPDARTFVQLYDQV